MIRSGSQAEYVETGHLIYADAGTLWAVRFDLAKLELIGDAVPVIEHVMTLGEAANFSVSRDGTVVYVPMGGTQSRSLVWVNRQGQEEAIAAPPGAYLYPRLSPDGTRVAVTIRERETDLWTWDFSRRKLTPLTFGPAGNFLVWTPDGRRVVFTSVRNPRNFNLSERAVDGTGNEERLTTGDHPQRADAISPDGKRLVFEELSPATAYDLMVLDLDRPATSPGTGAPRTRPLLQTLFDERSAVISPDGRWMAYESNESARSQVYVRPFPNLDDAHYQISTDGGRAPVWGPNGLELFFVNGSAMMVVAVQPTPTFSAGNATMMFQGGTVVWDPRRIGSPAGRTYDVSPDGRRFLMIKDAAATDDKSPPASIVVVQNWQEELKAKVAGRK